MHARTFHANCVCTIFTYYIITEANRKILLIPLKWVVRIQFQETISCLFVFNITTMRKHINTLRFLQRSSIYKTLFNLHTKTNCPSSETTINWQIKRLLIKRNKSNKNVSNNLITNFISSVKAKN